MNAPEGEIIEVVDETLFPACLDVIRTAFGTVAAELGFTAQTAPTNPAFWTLDHLLRTRREGARLFALLASGAPVATVALRPARRQAVLDLTRLAVLPQHRHRGYGRALLDRAFGVARSAGAGTIAISIIAENRPLERWYLAYGFSSTGTRTFDHLPFTVEFMEKAVRADGPADSAAGQAPVRSRYCR
jgi:GNAT superfamily N-acetyltransferase